MNPHLSSLRSQVLQRVAELHAEGPGDVQVGRVSDIAVVRTLRDCREELDADETAWLAEVLTEVERQAFGIQVSGLSRLSQEANVYRPEIDETDPVEKVWTKVIAATEAVGIRSNIRRLLNKSFPPKQEPRSGSPLPPPENLILAAEAWLLGRMCSGRVDTVNPLLEPWEQASVLR